MKCPKCGLSISTSICPSCGQVSERNRFVKLRTFLWKIRTFTLAVLLLFSGRVVAVLFAPDRIGGSVDSLDKFLFYGVLACYLILNATEVVFLTFPASRNNRHSKDSVPAFGTEFFGASLLAMIFAGTYFLVGLRIPRLGDQYCYGISFVISVSIFGLYCIGAIVNKGRVARNP